MSRVLSLFVFIVAVIASINAQDVINVGSCTDTILCRAETCTFQPIATGSCLNASNSTHTVSQLLLCNPNLQTVGELFVFSDPYCTVPMDSQSFICGQCTTTGKNPNQQIECIQKNGYESLVVNQCSDSSCQDNCKTAAIVPKSKCTASQGNNGQSVYFKYEGVQISNTIDQLIYEGSSTCSGKISQIKVLPSDHCIATVGKPTATLLNCRYAANNESSSSSSNSVHRLRRDPPCPKHDEHKLECAIAIADCTAECFIGDKRNHKVIDGKLQFDPVSCVECIVEKVGDGKAKECCQTLSHFFHFGCNVCDHV